MAKIGLRYPVYKTDTSEGVIAKAIQADITITTNDVKLYADDAIVESDRSFQSGTITLGTDNLKDEIQKEFLGHSITNGEITASGSDVSPYVSVGFYGVKVVSGVKKYRAVWLPKVQFEEPEDTNATKGESIEYGTHSLVGTILLDDNGNWKKEQTFDTEAEAIVYLQNKSGVKYQAKAPTADIASGSYDEPQTVTLTSEATADIYYTTNGITPTSTTGTKYTTPISIAESCALKAIAVVSGKNNSTISTYEYIIEI